MAEKQTIIIEEIAKVDSVLDGIKKIQQGFNGLTVPKDLQRQFEEIYKKIGQQAEKAKQAASSGFETKGDVKKFLDALSTMSRLYSELETKAGRLDAEKLAFGDAKGLKDFDDHLKELKKDLDNAKQAAADFGDSIKDKVQAGFDKINGYKNKKSIFKEWGEAQDALYNNNDIDGFKKKIQEIGAEFEKLKTQGIDLEKSAVWSGKYKVYQEMLGVLQEYDQEQQNVITKEQEYNDQLKVRQDTIDATKGKVDNLTAATKEAANAAQQAANNERQVVTETQRLNSELEHFKNKAAYFFGMGNAINLFKRAVRSAYNTVKDLDAVMTETAVVTDFSVGDMWTQLPEYTQRANELGVTIHDTYEAATLFYQQGLKTNEVMQISNETLKMARIAGLDAATASDRMTNALRGFNMELDKTSAQRVNDVYSKLAAITASNTDEISTAMTKVASLAHNANMEFETTAAFLAQIIESTRESAETAGTALKTVVARFSEVKKLYTKGELLGQDEEGEEIDVNKVSTALRSAGINLNEYLTGAKGLDDIFIELAEKWDSLDQVQQRYIATMAAGSRQQSRFIALMSDYKRTVELVEAANNANGASEEQYGKTLESLQTKLARLKNAWNEFILGLANSEVIKGAVDLLTDLITAINNLIKAVSGKNSAVKIITTFFTAFTSFKIGKKLFGGSTLGKFFAGLVQDGSGQAVKGATNIARVFYDNLSTRIANYNQAGGISSSFKNFSANLVNGFQSSFSKATPEMVATLKSHLDTTQDITPVLDAFKSGKYTIEEFNQVLKNNGQTYQLTADDAAKMGIAIKNNNSVVKSSVNEMRVCATAAMGLGAAFMGIGSILENMDGPAKEFGTVLKFLGGGLMTFGTIMSVTLPLMAQTGAKGVTAAITSIPIVGWITLIITLLGALAIAIYNVAKNHSAEAAAERSAKAAKEAADAANEAKEAYEKLGEAWSSLDDKYDAIDNAVKGTQEWRDAIRAVNTEIIELLDLYDDIEVYRDEDGILKIKNKEQVDERLRETSLYADANARFTKIQSLNDLQYSRYKTNVDKFGGAEPYKDVIDALQASGQLGLVSDDEIRELLKADFEQKQNGLNPDLYIDAVKEYGKDYLQNQQAIDVQKTLYEGTVLEMANVEEGLEGFASSIYEAIDLEELYNERMTQVAANEGIDPTSLQEEYARARGYDDFKEYQDKNPEEKVTGTEMREFVASAQTTDEIARIVNEFINNLDNLTVAERALFESSDGAAFTKEQIDELTSLSYDPYELYKKINGDEIYGSFDVFMQQFNKDLEIAASRFDTSKFAPSFVANLDESLTANLTSGAYKTFTDNLMSVYTVSGKEGMNKIQDSLLAMTKDMEPEERERFINDINAIDWASADSVRSLDELIKEYDISEDAIENFKNQIIEFNNTATKIDLEKLSSVLGLIKKIGNGEQGRSFTEEDYKNLIQHGVSEKDFQYNIETGNYDYTGQNIEDITTKVTEYLNTATKQIEKDVTTAKIVDEIGKTAGSNINLNDQNELGKFLSKYAALAGDNSVIDWDTVKQGTLAQYQEAYNKVMEAASRSSEEELEQVNQRRYQIKTGADLAALANVGDEDAINALKQQIVNSGLSQAIIDALLEDVESGEEEKITAAGGVIDTVSASNQYGISTEDLEAYVTALRTVDELQGANEATLYGLALANANYQQGFKSVIESYEEWIELKQEDGSIRAEDGNEEQLKAFDKLKKDLKQMFNLTEDVSDEFFKSAENVELLEAAVNGDTEAVSKLRAELAKTKIDLVINDENVKNQVYDLFDDIISEAGTLEFGASLNMAPAMQALQQLLEASGITVSEMAEIFESFGWTPEVTEKAVPFTSFQQMRTQGYQEVVDPVTHETVPIPTEGEDYYVQDGMILVPVFGGATFTPPEIPSFSPSTSSGGGGGGGSEKKPSYWKNPYDELYNLQEKINEALRTREALERRYQKLLKQEQATLSDIRKSYYDQIEHLGTEAELQTQLAEGRLRQIKKLGNELYTDEDGDRVSYKEMGVTKYASYDEKTGLIKIDWNALEEISNDSDRTEEGKAAEEYISKLEELVSSYEEVRDKLWEIEDTIEQLREDAIQSYISFEDRVMDALINQYQKQIDSYQSMSDALEEANNEVLDSLREQIDLSRQIRDNTEKEQDIADMENRLAYLQRDTSGANDLEILKLQKNLDDARQSYTDTLIDQAISNMEKDASLAAEQRTKQIQIMQAQLDMAVANGTLWKEVHDIINDAADENGALSPQSNLIKLLEESEGYKSLSAIGKEDWLQKAAEEFHKAWVGLNEAEDKFKVDANSDGTIYDTSTPTENTNSNNSGFKWDTTEKRKRRGDGKHKWSAFKTGGLADYTGPAWLDGTKTNPELILNAQDSANFIALKDILASLLNIQGANGKVGKGGDNYFDIDISATLESDYDVDKLTEKIKRDIYNDGQYRNVNTINYLR